MPNLSNALPNISYPTMQSAIVNNYNRAYNSRLSGVEFCRKRESVLLVSWTSNGGARICGEETGPIRRVGRNPIRTLYHPRHQYKRSEAWEEYMLSARRSLRHLRVTHRYGLVF